MYSLNFIAPIIKYKKNMLNESALQPNTIQQQKRQKESPKYNIYGSQGRNKKVDTKCRQP